jgi:DnaK suppressor protein
MATRSNRKARFEELRARLLAERATIPSDRQSQRRVLSTPANAASEDQAPLLHDQFVAISTTSRHRRKLALIDGALDRLARGEYGLCDECGEPIPLKRLQAVPWAEYCIPCQERMESVASVEEEALAPTA